MTALQGLVVSATGGIDRKKLNNDVRAAGGQISSIVHKRVSFVLATRDAVRRDTQRVRKAKKHSIPLVGEGFVADCVRAGTLLDHGPYLILHGGGGGRTGVDNNNKNKEEEKKENPGGGVASEDEGGGVPDTGSCGGGRAQRNGPTAAVAEDEKVPDTSSGKRDRGGGGGGGEPQVHAKPTETPVASDGRGGVERSSRGTKKQRRVCRLTT